MAFYGVCFPIFAGHVCDKEKGFCDHFQKCRLVNGKGPLARLKDLIFSETTLQLVKDWVTVSFDLFLPHDHAVGLNVVAHCNECD